MDIKITPNETSYTGGTITGFSPEKARKKIHVRLNFDHFISHEFYIHESDKHFDFFASKLDTEATLKRRKLQLECDLLEAKIEREKNPEGEALAPAVCTTCQQEKIDQLNSSVASLEYERDCLHAELHASNEAKESSEANADAIKADYVHLTNENKVLEHKLATTSDALAHLLAKVLGKTGLDALLFMLITTPEELIEIVGTVADKIKRVG